MDDVLVVIPARYGSTRLPRKLVRQIAGIPLIRRVTEEVVAMNIGPVVVATDHPIIAEAVGKLAPIVRTSSAHMSGTDRIAEVLEHTEYRGVPTVLNIQGDQLGLPVADVRDVVRLLNAQIAVATMACPLSPWAWAESAHVKVVVADGQAMGFFRVAALPVFPPGWVVAEHVGVYAYRSAVVKDTSARPRSHMEEALSLEQVRFLEAGYRIGTHLAPAGPRVTVDTPGDLQRARELAW